MVLSAFAANAARPWLVQFGVTGGMTSMGGNFKDKVESHTPLSMKNRTGAVAGLSTRLHFMKYRLTPEVIYSYYNFRATTPQTSNRLSIHTLDVPVMFSKNFLFLTGEIGPVFNLMTTQSVSGSSSELDFDVKRAFIGYAAGLGLDFNRFSISFRYTGQFGKSTQKVSGTAVGGDYSFKARMDSWRISLGLAF